MTASERPTLAEWSTAFTKLEANCPWPGPRPLGLADGRHLLVGRDHDIARFASTVEGSSLVILSGESGVGKSSFFECGLAPALRSAGKFVAVCRDWNGVGTVDAETFLAKKIEEQLRPYLPDLPASRKIFPTLSQMLQDRCVLVFDQFEELVRDAPGYAEKVYDTILKINRTTKIRVVISLRSEYLHRLHRLETEAKNFTVSVFRLKEIDPTLAEDVIEAGQSERNQIRGDDAVALATCWRAARTATVHASNNPFGRVGLLHLQALLYTLDGLADGGPVDLGLVEKVGGSHEGSAHGEAGSDKRGSAAVAHDDDVPAPLGLGKRWGTDPQGLFISGLLDSIKLKMNRCIEASGEVGVDPYLIEGTKHVLASSVRHLASDGFKLVRGVSELAVAALGGNYETLKDGISRSGVLRPDDEGVDKLVADGDPTDRQIQTLLRVVVRAALGSPNDASDLLTIDRGKIAETADGKRPGVSTDGPGSSMSDDPSTSTPPERAEEFGGVGWEARLHVDAPPGLADPGEVTCGPMSGMAPAAVLIEEFRRYAFALVWLQASSLVRISSPGEAGAKVALIHDGFGEALERWSGEEVSGPAAALHALTTPRGASFGWQFDPQEDPLPELDGGRPVEGEVPQPKLLVNLRWKGAWVRANFRNVAFVNCDLRGTYFAHCVLEGVTFVNCQLDGVGLDSCHIRGASKLAEGDYFPDAVPYWVPSTEDARLAAFWRYRGDPGSGDPRGYAAPEVPPAVVVEDPSGCKPWEPEPGGVTILGGRVSAFTLKSCTFEPADGETHLPWFSLRRAGGSGLDVVEQQGGQFEIFASAMRHITFTAPAQGVSKDFTIVANKSALIQMYLGENLNGTFRASKGLLAQIWNGSPNMAFEVRECPYFSLVNTTLVEDSTAINQLGAPISLDEADPPPGDIRDRAKNMDYHAPTSF